MAEQKTYRDRGWKDAILAFWLQLFGLGGSIGLASILQGVIFWKGVFALAIGWWDEWVRPFIVHLFSWAFDLFNLNLSDFWKDWLAVGLIVGLGFLRHVVLLAYKRGRTKPDDDGRVAAIRRLQEQWNAEEDDTEALAEATSGPLVPPFLSQWTRFAPLIYFIISPVLWPLAIALYVFDTFRAVWPPYDYDTKRFIVYAISTVILPFYYLLVLIAVNELILK